MPGRLGNCENATTAADSKVEQAPTATISVSSPVSQPGSVSPINAHQVNSQQPHLTTHHHCNNEREEEQHGIDSSSAGASDCNSLPPFIAASEPSFKWGEVDGESFVDLLDTCYTEVVQWRRNIFKVPSGKAGKDFVVELTRLLRGYTDGSTLECVALKAAMVMPPLLLQKTCKTTKSRDHVAQLERRLVEWKKGNINSLLHEGRTIQERLPTNRRRAKTEQQLARTFSQLMAKGRIKDALCLLSQRAKGRVLPLDEVVPGSQNKNVRQILEEKHPSAAPFSPSAVENVPDPLEPHPVIFDRVDSEMIRRVTIQMGGAAGPSGLDAAGWKRLCTSFRAQSIDLCDAMGRLARKLATVYVDPAALAPLVACRLIALDKCPGVRPIGVGEVLRRIVCRAISITLRLDIKEAAGPMQLCAGHESGCEAAVHTMREIYNDPSTDGVLLVDASNAFDQLFKSPNSTEKC